MGGRSSNGRLQIDVVPVGGKVDEPDQVLRGRTRAKPAIEQRLRPVGDDLGGIEIVKRAQAVALGAGPEGGVEREAARLELGNVQSAIGAGHGGRKQLFLEWGAAGAAGYGNKHQAIGQLQGFGHRSFEALLGRWFACGEGFIGSHPCPPETGRQGRGARLCGGFEKNPINHRLDGVVLAPIEDHRLGEVA